MAEVKVTQYLRPDGHTREMFAKVDDEHARKAEGMEFSAEVLTTGKVAVYGKLAGAPDEQELCELADNRPGYTPTDALLTIIDRLDRGRANEHP